MESMKKCMNWMHCPNTGLFLVRLGIAIIMIYAGFGKLSNVAGTSGFFGSIGLSVFWVYVVGIIELVGGVAMLLGVFTRVAGILFAIIMVVAIILVKSNMGFQAAQIDVMLFFASLGVAFTGPGTWSLMKKCGCCENCDITCKDGSCCGTCKVKDTK